MSVKTLPRQSPAPSPDHATLRLLAALPMFRQWRDPQLPASIARWLEQADSQQLMSATAVALNRLHRKPIR